MTEEKEPNIELSTEDIINFAEKVLDADPSKGFTVEHVHKYFGSGVKQAKMPKYDQYDESNSQIIFTEPGKARLVELKLPDEDPRAGEFPQHNSIGDIPTKVDLLPSLKLDLFEKLATEEALTAAGFETKVCSITKKRIEAIQKQFENLSLTCFSEMMCIDDKVKQRDYDVHYKFGKDDEVFIAYVHPEFELVQYFQSYKRDEYREIIDVKHIVCEHGEPIVMNQSAKDKFGITRNMAHVGITGSTENAFRNSLERYDDGSILWTTSDYKFGRQATGAAILKMDGLVYIVKGSDRRLGEFSARNLGAEGINPKTLAWTGKFDHKACVPEKDDKYIVRREYKNAVRQKCYQIIDGACIPGFEPVFIVD